MNQFGTGDSLGYPHRGGVWPQASAILSMGHSLLGRPATLALPSHRPGLSPLKEQTILISFSFIFI